MTSASRHLLLLNRSRRMQAGVTYHFVFSSTDKTSAIPANAFNVINGAHLYPQNPRVNFKGSSALVPVHGWDGSISAAADVNVNTILQGTHNAATANRRFRVDVPNGVAYIATCSSPLSGGAVSLCTTLKDGALAGLDSGSVSVTGSSEVLTPDGTKQTFANYLATPNEMLLTITQGYITIGASASVASRPNHLSIRYVSFA